MKNILQIDPRDNAIVALRDLNRGTVVRIEQKEIELKEDIKAKHKFALNDLSVGSEVYMYGVLVGKTVAPVSEGGSLNIFNLKHATSEYSIADVQTT